MLAAVAARDDEACRRQGAPEHIACLGSVPLDLSAADRIAFWTKLDERFAGLANRIDFFARHLG